MMFKTAISLFLIVSFYTSAAIADIEKDIQEVFEVGYGGNVKLKTDRGSVNVSSHDLDKLIVNVHVEANTWSKNKAETWFEDLEIKMESSGDDVIIMTSIEKRARGTLWGRDRLRVRYDIIVPRLYNLHLDTGGGAFRVSDVEGEVWLKTSGGSIALENIVGNVRGNTSGGSITTNGIDGDLNIKTSGGSLRLENIKGNVLGRTSGGSINANILGQITEGIDLKTSGGSITLVIPADLNANLDASTSGGRIMAELPILVSGKTGSSSLKGEINDGGVSVKVHTSGGNISIETHN